MQRKIILLSELIGSIATIVTFVQMFVNENYIVAGLLIVIFLILIYLLIRTYLHKPIIYKSILYTCEMMDPYGHEAIHLQEITLVAKEKNIVTLTNGNFSSSGKLEFLSTNIGKLLTPIDIAGTKTVYTLFTSPLPINQEIKHCITSKSIGSFYESEESFGKIIDKEFLQLILLVKFNIDRPPIELKAYCFFNNYALELNNLEFTDNGLTARIVIDRPKFGSKYIMQWKWKHSKLNQDNNLTI
jgi:hypothetical protein